MSEVPDKLEYAMLKVDEDGLRDTLLNKYINLSNLYKKHPESKCFRLNFFD